MVHLFRNIMTDLQLFQSARSDILPFKQKHAITLAHMEQFKSSNEYGNVNIY